jgi:predicted ribosomally synthesized peptide with SipW-like signal peptide
MMMKKSLVLMMTVALLALLVGVGYAALFSDTETASGTFTAGSLDLVLGEWDTITGTFYADNMYPGAVFDGGCVELTNAGTIPGKLSFMVDNLYSGENGTIEPEKEAGDISGTQIDVDGYNNNGGAGELWDNISIGFCIDAGAGSHATNHHCDWDDIRLKSPGSTYDDYSSYYSIPVGFDFAASKNIILDPGETITFCTEIGFWDSLSNKFWGASYGPQANNLAQTDDAQLDYFFGLVQAVP